MAQNPSSSSRSKAKSSTRKSPAKPEASRREVHPQARRQVGREARQQVGREARCQVGREARQQVRREARQQVGREAAAKPARPAAPRPARPPRARAARRAPVSRRRPRRRAAPPRPPPKGARSAGVEAKTVAELRDALRKNLIRPMEIVMISRERIEEVLGEAVDQGRVTVRDAQRISAGLVKRGQRQTSDVLKDLENLLDRGRGEVGVAHVDRPHPRRPQRLAGAGAGRPRAAHREGRARRSRSPATTISPQRRSRAASGPSPRPSCARCATTSAATRTARRFCSRSSPSSAER